MEIRFATLNTCESATGVVVVIDVARAFSTAAYAFGAGAGRILLAGTVEEALALRERLRLAGIADALVMGESSGLPVEGFDLWNSPVQVSGMNLAGCTLVQRTSSGTQGMVRSTGADYLLGGSFVVASATVRAVQQLQPASVTFVITGGHPDHPDYGAEDRACSEYMAALLHGERPDARDYLDWLEKLVAAHRLDEMPPLLYRGILEDIRLCQVVDCFPFAMPVRREDGMLVMEKCNPTAVEDYFSEITE